MFSATKEEKF